MQEENNVVYGLSEEELEDYAPIVTNVIKEICVFSDFICIDRLIFYFNFFRFIKVSWVFVI